MRNLSELPAGSERTVFSMSLFFQGKCVSPFLSLNYRPPKGAERPPSASQLRVGFADLRRATDSSLRLDAYRRGSYRLTPAAPGLRAPAHRNRRPKPPALSGRGGHLDTFMPAPGKIVYQVGGGQGSRASPEAAARPKGETGRGLGRSRTLDA